MQNRLLQSTSIRIINKKSCTEIHDTYWLINQNNCKLGIMPSVRAFLMRCSDIYSWPDTIQYFYQWSERKYSLYLNKVHRSYNTWKDEWWQRPPDLQRDLFCLIAQACSTPELFLIPQCWFVAMAKKKTKKKKVVHVYRTGSFVMVKLSQKRI